MNFANIFGESDQSSLDLFSGCDLVMGAGYKLMIYQTTNKQLY